MPDGRGSLIAACAMAILLSGCALSDENLSRVMVAPGKFSLYTCPELVAKGKELSKRERELAGLIAKARASAGGGVVSELAYRPDYVAAQGELRDVREAAAAKQCDLSRIDSDGAAAPSEPQPTSR
ncbi:MAG TPA: twin-arginine translocation pathway signal [Pseudolabrys sp.]|nr:twin-arginine translocation pathway signal [Pseudolabrys sp.]